MRTQLNKIILAAGLMLAMVLTFISCANNEEKEGGGGGDVYTFTDKGNDIANYETKQIGEQVWMAENLNYNVSGSKCYGEDGSVGYGDTLSNAEIQANCDKYGRLYDWETTMKVCPSDWHLPSDGEWEALFNYVKNDKGCGNLDCVTKYLKATSGWSGGGNGEDTYGFSALPGGSGSSHNFSGDGQNGTWWTSSYAGDQVYSWGIGSNDYISHYIGGKSVLYSVRCVQD